MEIHKRMVLQVMDMFVEQTHEVRHEWRDNERPMRFTDTRLDEQERAISLKMVPMSLVMEGSSGKSYLLNLIDTPGTPRPSLPCQCMGFAVRPWNCFVIIARPDFNEHGRWVCEGTVGHQSLGADMAFHRKGHEVGCHTICMEF